MSYEMFIFDKAANVIVEELFAPGAIKGFYQKRALKIQRIDPNPAIDTPGKRKFDLIDAFGKKWEVKDDRKANYTGNVFIELLTLNETEADYFLIFALAQAIVIPTVTLKELVASSEFRIAASHRDPTLSLEGALIPFNQLAAAGELFTSIPF